MTVERTVALRFTSASQELETHTNLSAVRSDGAVLWVAGDETATVERLVAEDAGGGRSAASRWPTSSTCPAPAEEEADVEGLARDGGFLWAVGSHSLRRKRVKDKHDGAKALERLATVEGQANRQVLLRLPLEQVDGLPQPVRETEVDGEVRRAASFGSRGKDLRDLLEDDERLRPFLPIPGKDNGLDVEGIAVARRPGAARPARSGAARLGVRPGAAAVRRRGRARPAAARRARRRPPLPHARARPRRARACATSARTATTCWCSPGRRWTSTGRCTSSAGTAR